MWGHTEHLVTFHLKYQSRLNLWGNSYNSWTSQCIVLVNQWKEKSVPGFVYPRVLLNSKSLVDCFESETIQYFDYFCACPHRPKKARFESRLFFYACPHTGRKIATQIAPVRASCACVLFVNRQRKQTAERPPCMMGYKKPVRFSFTVLTHFAQKIVAIIFKKDALLVVRGSRSESH